MWLITEQESKQTREEIKAWWQSRWSVFWCLMSGGQRGGQKTIVYKQHNCSANVSDQRNMRVEENKLRKNNEFY